MALRRSTEGRAKYGAAIDKHDDTVRIMECLIYLLAALLAFHLVASVALHPHRVNVDSSAYIETGSRILNGEHPFADLYALIRLL